MGQTPASQKVAELIELLAEHWEKTLDIEGEELLFTKRKMLDLVTQLYSAVDQIDQVETPQQTDHALLKELDAVNQRFNSLVRNIQDAFDKMVASLDQVEQKVGNIESRQLDFQQDMLRLENRVDELKDRPSAPAAVAAQAKLSFEPVVEPVKEKTLEDFVGEIEKAQTSPNLQLHEPIVQAFEPDSEEVEEAIIPEIESKEKVNTPTALEPKAEAASELEEVIRNMNTGAEPADKETADPQEEVSDEVPHIETQSVLPFEDMQLGQSFSKPKSSTFFKAKMIINLKTHAIEPAPEPLALRRGDEPKEEKVHYQQEIGGDDFAEAVVENTQVSEPQEARIIEDIPNSAIHGYGFRFKNFVDPSQMSPMELRPVDNLKTAIGLNEKFLYIRELFGNQAVPFADTLDQLNRYSTHSEAEQLLGSLMDQYTWKEDSEALQGFARVVYRRYL